MRTRKLAAVARMTLAVILTGCTTSTLHTTTPSTTPSGKAPPVTVVAVDTAATPRRSSRVRAKGVRAMTPGALERSRRLPVGTGLVQSANLRLAMVPCEPERTVTRVDGVGPPWVAPRNMIKARRLVCR
jgi:hypothetical protein